MDKNTEVTNEVFRTVSDELGLYTLNISFVRNGEDGELKVRKHPLYTNVNCFYGDFKDETFNVDTSMGTIIMENNEPRFGDDFEFKVLVKDNG